MIRDEIQIKYEREFAVREAVEAATKDARAQENIARSLAIAKALKQSNIDNETIAQCTGLSIEQVVEL